MASNPLVALQHTPIIPDEEEEPSFLSRIAFIPVRISLTLISKVFHLLRPLAPQLIPLAVCLIFIPIIVLLSISSGWIVWKNVAVSWETTLWLQYGYVEATFLFDVLNTVFLPSEMAFRPMLPPLYPVLFLNNATTSLLNSLFQLQNPILDSAIS